MDIYGTRRRKKAQELCQALDGSLYVPPFNNPLIWTGNASVIDEISEQMNGQVPDCIVASVGGGGLVLGLIEGMIRNGWLSRGMKIITVETEGADCFNKSVKSNQLVTLDSITRCLFQKKLIITISSHDKFLKLFSKALQNLLQQERVLSVCSSTISSTKRTSSR